MRTSPNRGVALACAAAMALSGCASQQAARARPDSLSLGRNAAGEPCTATRNWGDAAVTDLFDQSWSISCRNVAASRSLGTIRVVASSADRRSAVKSLDCGDAKAMAVRDIGDVEARRCYDALLGAE